MGISRQRKYQLKNQAKGLCETCGKEALQTRSRCGRCASVAREHMRKVKGCRKRYNSKSYKKKADE